MARGETSQHKIHYKGKSDDFLVFIDDVETYKKWLEDKSVPMAHFVSTFNVFFTHKQGVQGTYDSVPKVTMASEFDTEKEDDVIKIILEKGTLQTMEMPSRQGGTNDSKGAMAGH